MSSRVVGSRSRWLVINGHELVKVKMKVMQGEILDLRLELAGKWVLILGRR